MGSTSNDQRRLPPADYLHQLRVELARMGGISADQLDAPLPHIEGWTVHAVVGHTGWVARWATRCLQTSADDPPRRSEVPEPPPGAEVLSWFAEGVQDLIATVESADLAEPLRQTWTGPQPGSWWLRRLAHETAMHRWDAYAAFDSPDPIDSALALDGIDEVFESFAPQRLQFAALASPGKSMHLHSTDVDGGEWMVHFEDDGMRWEHAHAKGDVAARGPVSDLLLMLWSRLPPSRVEVFGDTTILDRWQTAAAF